MMLFHTDRKPLVPHLGTISALVFQLILTHLCRGQSQLIGSSQPIVATLGDDIILPCYLEPREDAAGLTLVWTRPDLNPRFVYVWRSGQELVGQKHKSFEGRTSLFTDELKNGNISLKLSKVKSSDVGTYRCFIPALEKESFVQLVIASNAVSLPVITLAGLDKSSSGVVLQCESKGWYPEPEVLWLDGEGNLLSAGPTETVRGPDDLYTVSSRVTVDKRHGNRFTCRVQQNNINQTRETHIEVTDDLFHVQSSISPATVGLVVCLAVCILSILSLAFILWKKQNVVKSKNRQWDENDKGQRKNDYKTEDQVFIEEREREQLMTDNTVQMEELEGEKKNKHVKFQTSKEHQKKVEAENTVKTLEEELETKKKEVENKETELQQLHEENQKRENNLQTLKNNLEDKNKELETVRDQLAQPWSVRSRGKSQNKKMKVEKEVETLKNQLETIETELQTKIKEIKDKQAEVQQLQDEIQMMETNLQMLMKNKSGGSRAAPAQSSSSSLVKWQIVSKQRFHKEKQRREEAERQVQSLETEREKLQRKETDTNNKKQQRKVETLKNQLEKLEGNLTETSNLLQDEKQKREEAEREVKTLKNQLADKHEEMKNNQQSADDKWKENNKSLEQTQEELNQTKRHVDELMADVKKLNEEKKRSETEQQQLQKELEIHENVTVEADSSCKYICLTNVSHEDQHLGGWEVKLQMNNENPIMYIFESLFSLKAQDTVKLWVPGYFTSNSPLDLVWKDLKSWKPTDKLQFILKKSKSSG